MCLLTESNCGKWEAGDLKYLRFGFVLLSRRPDNSENWRPNKCLFRLCARMKCDSESLNIPDDTNSNTFVTLLSSVCGRFDRY